jgi:hypothetical protein
MKHLGEMMHREPNDDEREAMLAVVEIAEAWQRHDLTLSSVRTLCTGRDRYQAMRFAPLGSAEKRLVMALVDALVAQDEQCLVTGHGLVNRQEVEQDGVKEVMTSKGRRAWVWPMHWMYGEPVYPRYDLPQGEERREKEEALRSRYKQYRDEQHKGRGAEFRRAS